MACNEKGRLQRKKRLPGGESKKKKKEQPVTLKHRGGEEGDVRQFPPNCGTQLGGMLKIKPEGENCQGENRARAERE